MFSGSQVNSRHTDIAFLHTSQVIDDDSHVSTLEVMNREVSPVALKVFGDKTSVAVLGSGLAAKQDCGSLK